MLVTDENIESYMGKRGEVKSRVVMLADASSVGKKLKQLVELSLPEEHPPVGIGKVVTVEATEILEFSGRPRFRGELITEKQLAEEATKPVSK